MVTLDFNKRFQVARVVRDKDGKHHILESEEHGLFRGAVVVARRMRAREWIRARVRGEQPGEAMYLIVDNMLFPERPPVYRLRDDGFTEGYRIPDEMKEKPCHGSTHA